MNQIMEFVHDPSWWFTAVFIAILASIVAGFLKDCIAHLLSKISQSYRKKTVEREEKQKVDAHALLENQNMLLITIFRTILSALITLMFFTIFNIFYALHLAGVITNLTNDFNGISFKVMMYSLGGLTMYGMYQTTPRIDLIKTAFRLCKTND